MRWRHGIRYMPPRLVKPGYQQKHACFFRRAKRKNAMPFDTESSCVSQSELTSDKFSHYYCYYLNTEASPFDFNPPAREEADTPNINLLDAQYCACLLQDLMATTTNTLCSWQNWTVPSLPSPRKKKCALHLYAWWGGIREMEAGYVTWPGWPVFTSVILQLATNFWNSFCK